MLEGVFVMSDRVADARPRTVYVPLHYFVIEGKPDRKTLAPGVVIERFVDLPSLDYWMLGFDERRALVEDVVYWLTIREPRADEVTAATLANAWIFSLWLVRPTKAGAHHRFDKFDDAVSSGSTRLLSRACHNRFDSEHNPFSLTEIEKAALFLAGLHRIDPSTRLGFAVSLSLESTWAHRWSAGLIGRRLSTADCRPLPMTIALRTWRSGPKCCVSCGTKS